jgi:hypothetical protein
MFRTFLCSEDFPAISDFPANFLFHIKLFDILVSTRIGLAPFYPSGSAHLFGINAGVSVCEKLVLI